MKLGKKTNLTSLEKGGRAPVSQRNDHAPRGVGSSVVKIAWEIGSGLPILFLAAYVYLLDNKYRRASSGILLIAEKRRGAGPPFLVYILGYLFRTFCEKFQARSPQVRPPDQVKWPNLKSIGDPS